VVECGFLSSFACSGFPIVMIIPMDEAGKENIIADSNYRFLSQ
jgi:hypothetical protein